MKQKEKGILVNAIRYGDHSYVCKIFLSKHGLKTFMVKSGQSAKTSKRHLLQPLTLVQFDCSIRENTSIQTLSQLAFAQPYSTIPFDVEKGAIVMFIHELLHRTIEEDYHNEGLYAFLEQALLLLDEEKKVGHFPLWFVIQVSAQYGFFPEPEEGSHYFDIISGQFVDRLPPHPMVIGEIECKLLLDILPMSYTEMRELNVDRKIRKRLLDAYVKYLFQHLGRTSGLNSLQVLEEVFQ